MSADLSAMTDLERLLWASIQMEKMRNVIRTQRAVIDAQTKSTAMLRAVNRLLEHRIERLREVSV